MLIAILPAGASVLWLQSRVSGPTAGDNRNETVALDKFASCLAMLLRTLAGAVGAVGAVRAVSEKSGGARRHASSKDYRVVLSHFCRRLPRA